MADVICSAIVHWEDGIVLVRSDPKSKWRIPTKTLANDEGPVLCVRRCIITETGYRAQVLQLFKIITRSLGDQRIVHFIFGCKIDPAQLQEPKLEVATFNYNELLELAQRDQFNDPLVLKLVHNFKNNIPTATNKFTESYTHI